MILPANWGEFVQTRAFELGEYVFKEGDPGDAFYVIEEGQVAIIKGAEGSSPLVLNFRGAGEMIGEIALLTDEPRTASVLAVEATRMSVMPRETFWRLFDESPPFREEVLQTLINRLLAADESRMQTAAAERELFNRLDSISDENERLAEIMQLRQETMRFIVHDLRNPLNLVMMALSMIDEEQGGHNPELERFVAMASGGVRRMFSLVESLLDLERLEAGEAKLDLEMLDINELVDNIVEEYRPLARASDVKLALEHRAGDLPPVSADRTRLERVLTNLLDNAVKFSHIDAEVLITTDLIDGTVQVAVDDGGPGIPPEQRSRVFDRFVQLEGQSHGSRGFGLGLAFCRSAIAAHGGRIWVEEGRTGGARFVFTLPVSRTDDGEEPDC